MLRATGVPPRRRRSRWSRVGSLLFVVWVNACSAWKPLQLEPARTFRPGERVRVQRSDERYTELVQVRVVADTLIGNRIGSSTLIVVPFSDIRGIETLHLSKGRTAVVLLALVGVAAAVAVGLAGPGGYSLGPMSSVY